MHKFRFRLSPAMIVSLIALFVALGGTSYAAITTLPANSVGTAQLKNSSVGTAQLKNSAVTGPKIANGAITAAKVSKSALPAATVVGALGAPAYAGNWDSAATSDAEGVSFYKDPWGIVHLQGSAVNNQATTDTIFTLPPGYRPAGEIYFAVYGGGPNVAYVQVRSDGEVIAFVQPNTYISLSNVSFRAGL